MAKKSTRVVLPFARAGAIKPDPDSENVMVCGGCCNELSVPHDLSGDEIQGIIDTHRTNCKLPLLIW